MWNLDADFYKKLLRLKEKNKEMKGLEDLILFSLN